MHENMLADLANIGATFPQVRILHLLEYRRMPGDGLAPCPRAPASCADALDGVRH
jgi:hypothetical protein